MKELTSVQSYTGKTVLTSPETDHVTQAIYQRKQLTVPIVATGTKMLKNTGTGPESIVPYLEFLVEAAEESMKDGMSNSTSGIFSANTESDTGITGLQNLLTTSNSTGTAGGISRATNSFWRQNVQSVTTGFASNGLEDMRTLFYACARGDESPSVIIVTQTTFANLARALTGTLSYNTPSPATSFGDIDFQNINFHGVPVIFDSNCPANTGYFLNLKYFKLLVHGDRDMTIRDWITPTDGDYILARLFWAGNLVTNNLARQGILTGSPDATG